MEEDVSDIKNDNNEKNYEKKTECLDDNSPKEIEEYVSDRKMIIVKILTRRKNWMPRWHFLWRDGGWCKWKKKYNSENNDTKKRT